jgi:hypothetical protein
MTPTEQDDFAVGLQQLIKQQWNLIGQLRQVLSVYQAKKYSTTPDAFTVIPAEKVQHAIASLSVLDATALASAPNATEDDPVTNQDNLVAMV